MKEDYSIPKNYFRADVIILGCSLPGVVTAHKLKMMFGDSMEIVILDLPYQAKHQSTLSVSFKKNYVDDIDNAQDQSVNQIKNAVRPNFTRKIILRYADELGISIPAGIITPNETRNNLNKLFEYGNGDTTFCKENYHNFSYLNFFEKFELHQYQALLDSNMKSLFDTKKNSIKERKTLMSYDKTSMESHICSNLLFQNSREIMRNIVTISCGTSASDISVLFYLHQCFRNNSCTNYLDNDNVGVREKLIGYCNRTLLSRLSKSIADITRTTKSITEIRSSADEKVILETMVGDSYICNLLAMALTPEQLYNITVETSLLSNEDKIMTKSLQPGQLRKFVIKYEENFWSRQGFSGDILSVKGPIIWAMERPQLSHTGSIQKYSTLEGFLKISNYEEDTKEIVIGQLIKLFGPEAANPTVYSERTINDIYVPRFGDFVALKRLAEENSNNLEWGALDVFAEGDVASALEAGHMAFLNLLSTLRPQAVLFDDITDIDKSTVLKEVSFGTERLNYVFSIRLVGYTALLFVCYKASKFLIPKIVSKAK